MVRRQNFSFLHDNLVFIICADNLPKTLHDLTSSCVSVCKWSYSLYILKHFKTEKISGSSFKNKLSFSKKKNTLDMDI